MNTLTIIFEYMIIWIDKFHSFVNDFVVIMLRLQFCKFWVASVYVKCAINVRQHRIHSPELLPITIAHVSAVVEDVEGRHEMISEFKFILQ